MRADAYSLEQVLSEKQQWVVPVYQRHYEWDVGEDGQLPKLWGDLQDQAAEHLEGRPRLPHYFGAIIYAEPRNQAFGTIRKRFLVDGQQRITTFNLFLTAFRQVAREHELSRHVDVSGTYLFNERSPSMREPDRECFKLWPSSYDRQLFRDIAECTPKELRQRQKGCFYKNGNLIHGPAPKMLRAFWYLYEGIGRYVREQVEDGVGAEEALDALISAFLSGFQIVVIQLDENDDAQEIFASLNGLSKPLAPFDLIRNDVFHRARKEGEDDERLFDQHWKAFEDPFWSVEVRQGRQKRARADHFIAHAVVAETAREVNVGKVAVEYQRYARERRFTTVSEELEALLVHACTYRSIEQPAEGEVVEQIARFLHIWDQSTFNPLLLWVNAQPVDDDEKRAVFRLLESYIVRRELCGLTSKNYNKVVIGLLRHLRDVDALLPAFAQHLMSLSGDASRMPTDAQLAEAFAQQKAYGEIPAPRLRYVLQHLEHAMRDRFDEVTVATNNLTIEHVMPQRWAEHWPLANGVHVSHESVWDVLVAGEELDDETKALMNERSRVVNVLGNLTLITSSLNPSMGNGPWSEKKERLGKSLLAMNRSIADVSTWDEEAVRARATALAEVATKVWPAQVHVSAPSPV